MNKAETYASRMDMSKQGVYDQLTSSAGEGFSSEAAQYAIDHLTDIDWNANALAKAKDYQSKMSMSRSAILEQLTSSAGEQFTQSQAQYAVDHLPK
ncbi:Ltp family lipoprotein [Lactiplantibacillus pentosus]|uniref:Ltp family lipoprotein n=1 Tax=Lactiplantibacillus pentosus TaxID=1589 RepID=UPI001FFC9C04|nr:Ltp family lipoprotein [Lactiplantibacillus pentosus]